MMQSYFYQKTLLNILYVHLLNIIKHKIIIPGKINLIKMFLDLIESYEEIECEEADKCYEDQSNTIKGNPTKVQSPIEKPKDAFRKSKVVTLEDTDDFSLELNFDSVDEVALDVVDNSVAGHT